MRQTIKRKFIDSVKQTLCLEVEDRSFESSYTMQISKRFYSYAPEGKGQLVTIWVRDALIEMRKDGLLKSRIVVSKHYGQDKRANLWELN